MLRCVGRQASRLISNRIPSTAAPVLVGKSVASQASSNADLLQQSRSFSSWFAPTRAVSASKGTAGGGSSNFGIATGLELEELEAQQEGKKRFDLDPPRGPFGTKEELAVIILPEDEHDVTWFKLKKGEHFECPVCIQVFELKFVGEGGLPGAHH